MKIPMTLSPFFVLFCLFVCLLLLLLLLLLLFLFFFVGVIVYLVLAPFLYPQSAAAGARAVSGGDGRGPHKR